MSSIFETVDGYVTKRKNTIIDRQPKISIFQSASTNTKSIHAICTTIIPDKDVVIPVQELINTNIQNTYVSSCYVIEIIWTVSVLCLIFPFMSNIHNIMTETLTEKTNLQYSKQLMVM